MCKASRDISQSPCAVIAVKGGSAKYWFKGADYKCKTYFSSLRKCPIDMTVN